VVSSGFCPDARRDEGAYPKKSVTKEQRSCRAKDTESAPPGPYETTSKQSRPKANPRSPNSSSPVPRSPNSPKRILESAIAARRKSQTELSDLAQWLADKSKRQTALETAGDLHNPSVLAEIGRLQIFTALLPRRIAAQEESDVNAEQALTRATNQFIQEHLGPRIQRLSARIRAIVESELSSHFRDAAALKVAVARSERVRHIESLAWSVSLAPVRGALEHAQGALKAWAAADEIEKTLNGKLH
jgi:hypothetical protein